MFNLASLIAGKKLNVNKNNEEKQEEDIKKSYIHGINVIFKNGIYKGYHGFVSDFFPATYELTKSGHAFIEAEKYGELKPIGTKIPTEFGESIIERIILRGTLKSVMTGSQFQTLTKFIIYKDQNDGIVKLGQILDKDKLKQNANEEQLIKKSIAESILDINNELEGKKQMRIFRGNRDLSNDDKIQKLLKIREDLLQQQDNIDKQIVTINRMKDSTKDLNISDIINPNNTVVIEHNISDIEHSFILNMSKMNIKEKSLDEYMGKLTIKNESKRKEKTDELIKIFSEEIKYNSKLFDNIRYPERNDNKISIIYNKDIIGPVYYMNEKGDFTEYDTNKIQYYISYDKIVVFKPSMIEIQEDKRFAKIKKGPYTNQIFRIKSYNKAKLSITLATNGQTIQENLIQKKDKNGEIINNQFENKPIYTSDVFYIDFTLKNGNKAELVKILQNNQFRILEKGDTEYIERVINEDEIKSYEEGFLFNSIVVSSKQVDNEIDNGIFFSTKKIEDEDNYDNINNEEEEEEFNENAEYNNYGEENENNEHENNYGNEYIEDELKGSFKDTQRTTVEHILTSKQETYKKNVLKMMKALNLNDDTIDLYEIINRIDKVIDIITTKLKTIDYNQDISVTKDIKYIIVCIVLYELFNYGYNESLDKIIEKLYLKYLTSSDITNNNLNNSIFLKQWDNLTEDIISNSVIQIKQYQAEKNDIQIFKIILINCNKIIQQIMNINVNIERIYNKENYEIIPLGVNLKTNKRYRDEENEKSMIKLKESFNKLAESGGSLHINNLLKNNIPTVEVPILWGNYSKILEKYKAALTEKYNNTNITNKGDYIYIRDNLFRAPFALREISNINVKLAFENIYKGLLNIIVEKITREEHQKNKKQKIIMENRKKFENDGLYDDDNENDIVVKNTRSYERERKLREMRNKIREATFAANREHQKNKKISEKTTDSTNDTDTIMSSDNVSDDYDNYT